MCKTTLYSKNSIEQSEHYSKLQINAPFKHDCTVKTKCYRIPKQEF